MARKRKLNYIYAIGRRKSASARVRLHKGSSESIVNDKPVYEYFSRKVDQVRWERPFTLTGTKEKLYVTVKVKGGGKESQLDASILGISRALVEYKKDKNREILKKAGLLSRDARIRERRKVGTGGKARRKKQSPKR